METKSMNEYVAPEIEVLGVKVETGFEGSNGAIVPPPDLTDPV